MAKKTAVKKARKYNNNPKEKLDNNEPWKTTLVIDKEVGYKIIEDLDKLPTGTEIQFVINKKLKKAYGIK